MTLSIKGASVRYGDSLVLADVDLDLEKNKVVALIGANGAGKTTLLKAIMGLVPLADGAILIDGENIAGRPPEARAGCGISFVPEGRRLFQGLSVQENLRMGAFARRDRHNISSDLDRIYSHFPELVPLRRQLAGTLSGGQQQMCAVGRALMGKPTYLLVDEMSLGLAPMVTDRLADTLAEIQKNDHIAVLMVEQDVELALEMASYGYVLETGRLILKGAARDLLNTGDIQRAYLGQ